MNDAKWMMKDGGTEPVPGGWEHLAFRM
jgi:hypothetical protein